MSTLAMTLYRKIFPKTWRWSRVSGCRKYHLLTAMAAREGLVAVKNAYARLPFVLSPVVIHN